MARLFGVSCPSEAEDAFQNTFMKYALCDKLFNDEEHKKAWLLRVAINICKDVLKAARRKDVSLDCQLAQANHVKGAFAGKLYQEVRRKIH